MSRIYVTERKDFTGGLNFRSDQFQLADNESPSMLNVEIDPRGGVFSRGGMRRLNTSAPAGAWAPKTLFAFTGTSPRLMLSTADRILHSTGGEFTQVFSALSTPLNPSSVDGASFVQWGDKVYLGMGATAGGGGYRWKVTDTYATELTESGTAPNAWQTTSDDTILKMPSCEHIIAHASKLWAANVVTGGVAHPNRIHWSMENSPTNWEQLNYIDINGGGDGITGVAIAAGQLIVFKPHAIYAIYGYDDTNFNVVEISKTLGVGNRHSIAATEGGVYFASYPEGLFFYNGSSVTDVFANIRPIIELGYVTTGATSPLRIAMIGRRVWLSAPYLTTGPVAYPTVNFVYNPDLGTNGAYTQFSTHDGKGLVAGCDWRNSAGEEYRVACHPTEPYVMQVDMYSQEMDNVTGTDTGFSSTYRTKWFDASTYAQKKMFRRPDFVVKETTVPQNITIGVYHDFNEAVGNEARIFVLTQTPPANGLIWGSGLWGENWSSGAVSSTILTGSNLGMARTVQLEFTGPIGQQWGLNGIGYKYQTRKIKG